MKPLGECGHWFLERAHTTLSGSRPRVRGEKIISIIDHLAEGFGQRRICRLVGVSRDSVSRLTRIAGDHIKALHDELVRGVQVKEAQFPMQSTHHLWNDRMEQIDISILFFALLLTFFALWFC